MRILIITAVDAEVRAIGAIDGAMVVAGGVGRTNAACATTEAILRARNRGQEIDAVISAGLGGALPQAVEQSLAIGDVIVASSCIYVEEGIITAQGFANMAGLGFALGDFEGNTVPVDERLLEALSADFKIGPIATVATCSGTDEAAREVVRRTGRAGAAGRRSGSGGAMAEAMEGAAVVHAARRLNVPAIELRAISNTTGDRARQQWDFDKGFAALSEAVKRAVNMILL